MFSQIIVAISLALAVAAQQCNTGSIQCCNMFGKTSEPAIAKELGLLGVTLQDVNVPVALQCTPITVIDVGAQSSCNAQPLCCSDNEFKGLVNIGCSPISL